MSVDELIEIVEKKIRCSTVAPRCGCDCNNCSYSVSIETRNEMYNNVLMRLKQEKQAMNKMEEMRVEEVD